MARKNYKVDMCNGPVLPKLLSFSLPLMASSVLQLLFNAADIVVVGRFAGDNSLAAVGSTSSLINLLTNLFIGLSIGANVVVARYYGSDDRENTRKTVHTAMLLALYSGVILSVIGVSGARVILEMMQSPPEILPLATQYMRIYFMGMVATMVYNFGSAVLRAVGDTRRPLYYLLLAGVINVVLNLIFVIAFKMDVAGVALATVISQCVSAALVVLCLVNETSCIRLVLKELHIYMDKFKAILRVGLPAGFQGIVFAISNVMIQSSVNTFGSVVVAGNAAAANIEGFVYVAMNAFYQAALSFTSQNYGAGNMKRINKILLTAEGCVIVVGFLLGNAALLFGKTLLGIYTTSAEVVAAGMQRLGIISRTYFLCGMMDVLVGSLRGIGYSVLPMVVSMVGVCGVRLGVIYTIFQMPQFHSIQMLYWTYPASWVVTGLVHAVCFLVLKHRLDKRTAQSVLQQTAN